MSLPSTLESDRDADIRRLEQSLGDMRAVAQVIIDVSRSLTLGEAMLASLTGIQRVVGGDFGCFLLIQTQHPTLRLANPVGLPPSLLQDLQHLTLSPEIIASAPSTDNPLALLSAIGQRVSAILQARGVEFFVLVPLTALGRAVGLLVVGSGTGKPPSPASADLLMAIGEQVGTTIDNARLHASVAESEEWRRTLEDRNPYAQPRRRAEELEGLAQLSAACTTTLDPVALADSAVKWVRKLLPVELCSIRLIEENSMRLLSGHLDAGLALQEHIEMDAPFRAVVEGRTPYRITDIEDSVVAPVHRQGFGGIGIRSFLAMPMPTPDRVIGILGIGHVEPHAWAQSEVDLLQTIANQIANALANAQLFQNVSNKQREVQAIFDSGLSGLYATDGEGKLVMFNRAAERITGWSLRDVQARAWLDILGDPATDPAVVPPLIDEALCRKNTAYVPGGRNIQTRDGRLIPVAQAVAPLLDEKGTVTGAVGAFWDLSREQAAELSRERFLTMVAHQLRSPLSVLLSALQLLERQNLSQRRRAQLRKFVKEDGVRLIKFADEFLDLEAAVKSPRPLHLEALPIVHIVHKLVDGLRANGRHHRFRVRSSQPEPMVLADLERVENVLRNLLDNAISYSPPRSVITVSVTALDGMVGVAVQDQGPGVPVEEQRLIFEPFYRRSKSSARGVYGHGLGLSIAKEMVKEMGGSIWVESVEPKGATFHFTLRRSP